MISPVVLCGGSGTRLWPLSRELYPKQFINLTNETSLFQDTILRLTGEMADPVIICNEEHRFIAAEQLRQINKRSSGIILEPEGKNTAPAIALAALNEINNNRDPILLVLSADHIIEDISLFHKSIELAKQHALEGKLVTFGAPPNRPETGYGYIELIENANKNYFDVKSFVEKPSKENARKYLNNGNFLWNTGIFMFNASTYLNELQKFEPEIYNCCVNSFDNDLRDNEFIRVKIDEFSQCKKKSIDYAVMEQTQDAIVIPLNSYWSDVGSWDRLLEVKIKDNNGNYCEGDVIIDNVQNSYIHSSNRLISAVGISNLVIIETKDSILVSDKNDSSEIKKLVDILKIEKRNEAFIHRKVYRPWGFYDLIDSGDGFQVKQLRVNPKSKLSLQKHQYRSEHWIVTSGKAKVTCGKKTFELKKNESTFIPKGEVHRLENQEIKPLEIIEVQTGDYLGEDDITRLEDDYHRNS